MTAHPFSIGDPVMDGAQGRAMIVLDAPDLTVEEWSDQNGYDLQGNYANSKFQPEADEPVVECVYVSDIRSEPTKTYTFPISRVWLIDAHHADGGRRIHDRVAVSVLESLFSYHLQNDDDVAAGALAQVAENAGIETGVIEEARELADVEQTIGTDG